MNAFLKSRKFMGGAALAAVMALGAVAVSAQDTDTSGPFGGRGGTLMVGRALITETANAAGITPRELAQLLQENQSTLQAYIDENGLSLEDITAAVNEQFTARLDQALSNGRITEEQAATLTEQFGTALETVLTTTLPERGNLSEGTRLADQLLVGVLMENTGLIGRELAAAAEGQTLEAYAAATGLDLNAVFAEVTARAEAFLTQRVAAGEITAEESATLLADLGTYLSEVSTQTLREHMGMRVRDRMNGPGNGAFGGPRGGQGGFGFGGPGGDGAPGNGGAGI
ncbi:MAG: hypothetical protein KME04_02955 [Pleurocapsa minor GSE-CHR-MK-17-07R]|nr:hypothetical protein [Pleurocapsa minor GSE-CHR-MK 17-07R]